MNKFEKLLLIICNRFDVNVIQKSEYEYHIRKDGKLISRVWKGKKESFEVIEEDDRYIEQGYDYLLSYLDEVAL